MPEYIEREAAIKVLNSEGITKNMRAHRKLLAIPAADVVEVSGVTPCDVCAYNPPSSCDGKPCCMCPATARMDGKGEGE